MGTMREEVKMRLHTMFLSALVPLLLFVSPVAGQGVPGTTSALIQVSSRSVLPEPAVRFGANINGIPINGWHRDSGFEPFVLRIKAIANGGGVNFLVKSDGETADFYKTIFDGFFDGADARVYRYVNGTIQKICTSTVKEYKANSESGNYTITLAGTNVSFRAGDVYFLSKTSLNPPNEFVHPRMKQWIKNTTDTWNIRGPVVFSRVDVGVAPGAGHSSLKMTALNSSAQVEMFQYHFGQRPYTSMPRGRMRVSLWLKQANLTNNVVEYYVSSIYRTVFCRFNATTEWKFHECTFNNTIGPFPLTGSFAVATSGLRFTGPGTLWVDNFNLVEDKWGVPPLEILPITQEALNSFKPSACRVWSGIEQGGLGNSLDDWLETDQNAPNHWGVNSGAIAGARLHLSAILRSLRAAACNPWLIVSASFSEDEWLGLLEYLAGPATSTYGKIRAAQGQAATWTSTFPIIYIERGNEQWNHIFNPWTEFNGTQQGMWAQYFYNVLKRSPYWAWARPKLRLVVNGWVISGGMGGYGTTAALAAPDAFSVDITAYTGGWELGGTLGGTVVTDEGLNNTLLYAHKGQKPFTDAQVATMNAIQVARGRRIWLTVYEGGPSYNLPNPAKPFDDVSEVYGKSMANAVGTLDSFLYNSQQGFDAQLFFFFGVGDNWASHANLDNDFRPHTSWLALQMRNVGATGFHVATSVISAAATRVSNADGTFVDVPLISTYAFKDGSTYHIFTLSRQLNGTTNVSLQLPFTSAKSTLFRKMDGGALAGNLKSLAVTIVNGTAPNPVSTSTGSTFNFTLPGASIYLWSFFNTTSGTRPCTATIANGYSQSLTTSTTPVRFLVSFSLPLNRSLLASDIIVGGTAGGGTPTVTESDPIGFRTNYIVDFAGFLRTGSVAIGLRAGSLTCAGGLVMWQITQRAKSVTYRAAPPKNAMLAYDTLVVSNLTAGYVQVDGVGGGWGWETPWYQQLYLPSQGNDSYRIVNDSTLPENLRFKMIGGYRYQTAGRKLNTSTMGNFSMYLTPGQTRTAVGKRGASLWFSFILKKESNDREPMWFILSPDLAYVHYHHIMRVGYIPVTNRPPTWGVEVLDGNGTYSTGNSNTSVVVGLATRLVMNIFWGDPPTIKLYHQPNGTSAPAQPPILTYNVSLRAIPSFFFRYVGFYAGHGINRGSIASIKIADTFAAVQKSY